MRFLLDTQIAIWAVTSSERLSSRARALIVDADEEITVSSLSLWEIAIKYPLLKRKDAPPLSSAAALAAFREARFALLDINPAHACAVEALPRLHGDPFDRLLVAQARSEKMVLLTADSVLTAYGDDVMLA